jgi:hypothetical protein
MMRISRRDFVSGALVNGRIYPILPGTVNSAHTVLDLGGCALRGGGGSGHPHGSG